MEEANSRKVSVAASAQNDTAVGSRAVREAMRAIAGAVEVMGDPFQCRVRKAGRAARHG